MIKAIIILPGAVGVFIPAAIIYFSLSRGYQDKIMNGQIGLIGLGIAFLLAGLALAVWTSRLFLTLGQGTPAPWRPPRKLVVSGPYRYVRNPMISGMIAILAGEALVFGSWLVMAWALLFTAANTIYLPLFEEKGLERRFGPDYLEYKRNVPRWLPRLKPWEKKT